MNVFVPNTQQQGMLRPPAFTDDMLLQLSRDTGWWLRPLADDYHDIRAHIPVLYAIARNCNWPDQRHCMPACGSNPPPVCLEIGVRLGISTIAILCAMREVDGKLISIEYDDGTRGDKENYAAKAKERIEAAGLSQWWQLEVADSNEWDTSGLGQVDFLWIDGAHDAEQVRKDVQKYSPFVRPNGMMVLHDYFSHAEPCDPPVQGPWISEVSIVVEECRATGEWEICVLPWSFGLALMRRLP